MPLEDRDIFLAICERFADQPIEFVMEQYEKAKLINIAIEQRIGTSTASVETPREEPVVIVEEEMEEPAAKAKKKYTRRMLKVKPQDAITDTDIFCCICGEKRQNLTARHLANHDITVEEYKKLCGYPADMPLMSRKRLAKSKEIIKRAQKARLDKKASMSED